jgi:hypothetical protein
VSGFSAVFNITSCLASGVFVIDGCFDFELAFEDLGAPGFEGSWGGMTDFSAQETSLFSFACSDAVSCAAFGEDSFGTLVFVAMMYHLRVLDRNCKALKNGGKISQKTADLSSSV